MKKGQRTIDSVLAQDIYDALVNKGYRVFSRALLWRTSWARNLNLIFLPRSTPQR